jgi:serine/threonine-protein kinase RsbW
MMANNHHTVRLEFSSAFEMLDLVQIVSDSFGRLAGLDDDGVHWIGVAIRESVINAIKHGNHNDAAKSVFVDFTSMPAADSGDGAATPPARAAGAPVESNAAVCAPEAAAADEDGIEIAQLVVHVRDQGEGFDPSSLVDPLAPENLLKSSGRGIFFMRSFMDDVSLRRLPDGGMEVRMVKKIRK